MHPVPTEISNYSSIDETTRLLFDLDACIHTLNRQALLDKSK